MVSPGLDNIQQSTFSYNFDYERRVEAEAAGAANEGSASGNQNVSPSQVTASIQVRALGFMDTSSAASVRASVTKLEMLNAGRGSMDLADSQVH